MKNSEKLNEVVSVSIEIEPEADHSVSINVDPDEQTMMNSSELDLTTSDISEAKVKSTASEPIPIIKNSSYKNRNNLLSKSTAHRCRIRTLEARSISAQNSPILSRHPAKSKPLHLTFIDQIQTNNPADDHIDSSEKSEKRSKKSTLFVADTSKKSSDTTTLEYEISYQSPLATSPPSQGFIASFNQLTTNLPVIAQKPVTDMIKLQKLTSNAPSQLPATTTAVTTSTNGFSGINDADGQSKRREFMKQTTHDVELALSRMANGDINESDDEKINKRKYSEYLTCKL